MGDIVKTCYICALTISRGSDERFNKKKETTRKILLKYLLKNRDKSETLYLYNTIANYVSERLHDDSLCSVEFCGSCDRRAEKVGKLLLKLNTIQKQIDDEVKEIRKEVRDADASTKDSTKLLKNDGSQEENIFLKTLQNFRKCVSVKTDINTNETESLSSSNILVKIIQNEDNNPSEPHETTTGDEIVPHSNNNAANIEEARGLKSNERKGGDEYNDNDVKVEDDDDNVKDEYNDQEDVSEYQEEELIDFDPVILNRQINSPTNFEYFDDSNYMDPTDINVLSVRKQPPPKGKVPNKALPNIVKESLARIHASISSSTNLVNASPRMEKVKRLVLISNSSRNNPNSSNAPLQKPQQTLKQRRRKQQFAIVQPKLDPDRRKLTRKVINRKAPPCKSESDYATVRVTSKSGKTTRTLLRCKLCPVSVIQANIPFEHHLRSHETTLKHYTCAECKMQFTTKQMHDFHKRFHSDTKVTKCNICSNYVKIINMKEHLKTRHQVCAISCPYCSYCFGKYHALLNHWRYHGRTPVKCVICPDSVFKSLKLLAKHFISFHEIDEADVIMKCDQPGCKLTFFEEYFKKAHMRLHEKIFECPTCGRCFSLASKLELHSRSHTEERTQLQLPCDVCPGKTFRSNSALLTHQRKEHGAAKLQCDQCDKSFFAVSGLQYHKKYTHGTGDTKFHSCHICEKKLQTITSYKNHMRIHSDTKDFICSECGFQTKSKDLLKHHEKRHFSEKTHKCPYCPKVFLTSGILKVHVRVHTKERPYVCDICGSDFNQHSAMMSHRKRHADITFVPRGSKSKSRKIID